MIHETFAANARTFPDRIAIEGANVRVTYAALAAAAGGVATALLEAGAGRGERVVVVAHDRAVAIVAVLGCFMAGAVCVALDPGAPQVRLAEQVRLVAPRRIVGDASTRLLAAALAAPASIAVLELSPPDGDVKWHVPELARTADDAAYITFTSGSTGQPKAILGRLGGIDHFVRWEHEYLGLATCRVSQLTHPSYDAFFRDVFLPLTTGGLVCLPPGRLAGAELWTYLADSRVDVLHTVPSVFRTLLDAGVALEALPLRHVLLAGEVLSPADARRWLERVGDRIALTNLYGPSETTMVKLFHRVTAADLARASIPIGRPLPETRVLLVDSAGLLAAPGAVGEIRILTRHAALGYWGDPEATAQAFVRGPDDEVPAYRTGDFGRELADGSLEFLGRVDRQVKIRGVRVELDEVEGALENCPEVQEAAVIARDDRHGNLVLCAYVAPAGLSESAVRVDLAARLPASHVPQQIVVLAALPRTISDKVDRRALPDPALFQRDRGSGFVAPETPLERELAGLWSELLGVPEISRTDHFFELGGDSLLATRLLATIAERHGARVRLVDFLERPSLSDLAIAVLAAGLAAAAPDTLERALAAAEAWRDTEELLAEFYGRFPWPWEAASFDVLEDMRIETLFRNQDVGDWQHARIRADGAIWVAGCGTNQAVITALRFPLARVLGTDLSETSLARARQTARELGLDNLELARESIADAGYCEQFDQVICTGVIHHNADPGALLARLGRAMRPHGVLELMVYSRCHREVTTSFQAAVRALCPGEPFEVQLEVARQLLRLEGVRDGLSRAFTQFMDASESDLADLLIQPIERSYTVDELGALADAHGLALLAPCTSAYARHLDRASWELELLDGPLRDRYAALADAARWQITQDVLHERSPLLWFYLERNGASAGEGAARPVAARMLQTRFRPTATTKRSYVRRVDGRYEQAARSLPFPATPPHPSVRPVLAMLEPGMTLADALARAGLQPDPGTLARVRRLLTTAAFPYLVAEAAF